MFFKFYMELILKFKKAIYVGEGSNVFYMVRTSFTIPFIRVHIIDARCI